MYFIDKLNIYQDHDRPVPLYGSNGLVSFDLETGEFGMNPIVFTKKYEGSYSSSLQIRSDGYRVSVTGNPSRYDRIDNLYGFYTIDECVHFYNSVLIKLGLPLFTKITKLTYLDSRAETNQRKTDGAVITHIDFTKNHSVGYGNEQKFIKQLSTQALKGSVPSYMYPNENTVEWYGKNIQGHGSSHRYVKCYSKAADLIKSKKRRIKDSLHAFDYYEKLLDFCIQQGVVREEHSFKSKFLRQNKLNFYGEVQEADFDKYLTTVSDVINRLDEVIDMKYENITQQLIAKGVCTNQLSANSTNGYYQRWLVGEYLPRNRQFREHRKRLFALGIDIAIKLDIHRAPIRLCTSETIHVRPLEKPSWYIDVKSKVA